MTKETDKEFFKEEINKLCKCFTELEKYYPELGKDVDHPKINFTSFREMKAELKKLNKFLLGKAHDIHPLGGMEQLESEVRALGYSPTMGIHAWFKKRLEDRKKITHESCKRFKPSSKIEGEIACVRKFCENKGQCLKDSQIIPEPENSPIDVIVKEDGRETYFQVTYIQREEEKALSSWGGYCGKGETPEEIGKEIEKVIKEKGLKLGGRKDITLLLVAFSSPIPVEHLEQAVTKLSIFPPFKEIYIVMLGRNFPIRTRPADEEP